MKLLEFIVKAIVVLLLPGMFIVAACFAPAGEARDVFARISVVIGFFDIIPIIMVVAGSNQKETSK